MASNIASVNTQFQNTEFKEDKSHYDLIATELLNFMREAYSGLTFNTHDFLFYHADPLSALDGIENEFYLNRHEKSCFLLLRACFSAMKRKYGNDQEMPTRIQFLKNNLLGLFQSMKSREIPAEEHRRAEDHPAPRSMMVPIEKDQESHRLWQLIKAGPQTRATGMRPSAQIFKKTTMPSWKTYATEYLHSKKKLGKWVRSGNAPILESDHQRCRQCAKTSTDEDIDEESVVLENPSTLVLAL